MTSVPGPISSSTKGNARNPSLFGGIIGDDAGLLLPPPQGQGGKSPESSSPPPGVPILPREETEWTDRKLKTDRKLDRQKQTGSEKNHEAEIYLG